MSIGKVSRKLEQTAWRLKNKILPGVLILMYHRVAEVDSDPWSLCVTPEHFAEHLEVLRKHHYPLSLQQLTQTIRDHQTIKRSVVITFDDGYADNFYNAKPLLKRYDIPATVFVTTGGIGHRREFWWDELDRLLLQPGILPEILQLNINGSTYTWELGEAAYYSQADYHFYRHWSASGIEDPSLRHTLYRSLYELLYPLSSHKREKVLEAIRVWANAEPIGRSTHRSMSREELLDLEEGGLIEVGAHTVTHPFLSKLPVALQQDEIEQSKHYIEEILGHPVTSFSYPHGDYTADTISIIQEAGFTCACCSVVDRVQEHSNSFLLPRVEVQDWDGKTFDRWLSRWL
ncbi:MULTISPECIES: polysaccharide deacetylase family protein [Moorena]|uniref:Polysaccharide deacetylase family protein n=2 Tax=Moorena producens TaxID=1155739 RepID=A0A1D9G1N9_MOOP1|nr:MULTISPECIES: polysaccharide deacetylase family protein [Moorena]AOY81435.1 polysaccharide deacetylase family protein [Moorena producens JHB]EGJ31547.1 putative xylanase/chitin deacetylase [Moorena producens 3L]NEP67739.1 polysaccharide deacetylase family protein [Moorena sp. SIO3A5]NEQ06198.1 polysaccharide deacetylase family protein [Moorena sp. SIO4E2]NER86158.1 polysaccharide deacetylase family protein [Moorena sp. SIO3A2]